MVVYHLPQYALPFIGRTTEIQQICEQIIDPRCRLLTLVGSGGVGKSRLAIECASQLRDEYTEGIYFVELQPITSASAMVMTLANTIGFEFYDSHDPLLQLIQHLSQRQLLLIFDNYEHLLPSIELIEGLLQYTTQVKLLVTSRQAINLHEEWLYHINGMTYPQEMVHENLDNYSAIHLFAERAQRVQHSFSLEDEIPHVIRICQAVDGLPLGIELAATWLKWIPCAEIIDEIQQNLDFLTTTMRGIPDRHHSMRGVFDYSWKMLIKEEQIALMQLAVFQGGFRKEAAKQAMGISLPLLASLVDKSILKMSVDGRYQLHELHRQYALEHLKQESDLYIETRNRHCAYFTGFMKRAPLEFTSTGNRTILRNIDVEINNVRAAWDWGVDHQRASDLYKATRGLYWYAWLRNWHQEGETCFREAIASLRQCEPTDENQLALASILHCLGGMNIWLQNLQQAQELLDESISLLRALDDLHELGIALVGRGWLAFALHDWESAKQWLSKALDVNVETEQYENLAAIYSFLGHTASNTGNYFEAQKQHQKALELGYKIDDQRTIAASFEALGEIALIQGLYARAKHLYERSLECARTYAFPSFVVHELIQLGHVSIAIGDIAEAEHYVQESLKIATAYGKPKGIIWSNMMLAEVFLAQGYEDDAMKQYQQAETLASSNHVNQLAQMARVGLGDVALKIGDYVAALQFYSEGAQYYQQIENKEMLATLLCKLGTVTLFQHEFVQCRQYFLESLQLTVEIEQSPLLLNTFAGIAEFYLQTGNGLQAAYLSKIVLHHPSSHFDLIARTRYILKQLERKRPLYELDFVVQETSINLLEIAGNLIEQLVNLINQPLVNPLSERELEVLHLVAHGRSNREIAMDLTLALGTVKTHLHNIMQKLDADNRTEAVSRARNLSLL